MPANTPGGWPYLLPADHPVEYPAQSQTLATKLDTVAVKGDPAWTTPATLLNGWVNVAAPAAPFRYRKVSGTVHVQATVKSGTLGAPVFTLPAGYRPDANLTVYGQSVSGTGVTIYIGWDGNVTIQSTQTGGNNTFIAFLCDFPV